MIKNSTVISKVTVKPCGPFMLLICQLALPICKGLGTLIEFRTIFTLAPANFAFDLISYCTKKDSNFSEAYTEKTKEQAHTWISSNNS